MAGPHPTAIARALEDLSGPMADLMATGRVSVVPLGGPRPEGDIIASASPLRDGVPSQVHAVSAGVVVSLASLRDLGRELVRAAYILAPEAARAEALAAVASEGGALVWAARERIKAGTAFLDDHRDLRWCADPKAWSSLDPAAHLERFSTFLDVYPTRATLALGAWEGLDGREAVCGAVYAHYIARHGGFDPAEPVAREAVAQRHARCPGLLSDLFARAALAAGHEPGPRP